MTKGNRIKKKREELNISQTELAKKIGVSKQTLYKYENDIITNIPSDKIEALAKCLGCSEGYIMGWDMIVWDSKSQEIFITKADRKTELYKTIASSLILREYVEKLASLPENLQQIVFNNIDSIYSFYNKEISEDE